MPNYFPLWLKTASWNSDVDFLLITDADMKEYDIPQNVILIPMNWEEIVRLFQRKFEFKIALDTPYKLCDFRPSYGEMFADYLQGYDFWGHCDIDLFWGKIRRFVTDDILTAYDRIYSRGHCSLYRNDPTVNSWYRALPSNGYQNCENVFSTSESRCFDEWAGHCGGGISMIIKANGIPVYDEADMADLNVKYGEFKVNRWNDYQISAFRLSEGKLKVIDFEGNEIKEALYVHFQKRQIKILATLDFDEFYFNPPCVISDGIERNIMQEKMYELNYVFQKIKSRIRGR